MAMIISLTFRVIAELIKLCMQLVWLAGALLGHLIMLVLPICVRMISNLRRALEARAKPSNIDSYRPIETRPDTTSEPQKKPRRRIVKSYF